MVTRKYCVFVIILLVNLSVLLASFVPDLLSTRRVIFNINKTERIFNNFLEIYNKTYRNAEEYNKRLEIFRSNLEDINDLNSGEGNDVYGITEHSDLSVEEFISRSGGSNWIELENDTNVVNFTYRTPGRSVPDFWDWRQKGVVAAVGNQGFCKSCWAFSASGLLEGQYARKYKKLVPLSTQQLLDCMKIGIGCSIMTFPHLAINAIAKQGGIMSDKDYRYLGFGAACRFDSSRAVARIKTAVRHNVYNEGQLKEMVYNYGPVAAGFLISAGFPKYKRGIASAKNFKCNTKGLLNHSVLIVGYGTENGVPYWIIKNSHGTFWGDNGYFKLERGGNPCNLMDYVATVSLL